MWGEKKWLWRQTETKGSLNAKIVLCCSISAEDPSPVTVVLGQQMAKCEQHGKPSGIPGKGDFRELHGIGGDITDNTEHKAIVCVAIK